MTTHRQFAALPWIDLPEGRQVLLVTTRGRGQWVVPKGWPKRGREGWEVAALEAFEEAGLSGEISQSAIGVFEYKKSLHFLTSVICRVEVFPLLVTEQRLRWRERGERQLEWMPLAEAVRRVQEPGLSELISGFAAGLKTGQAA